MAEGAISRPTSQASMHSNEISSKPTHGMVPQVHPSMLDRLYNSCNWENSMAGVTKVGTMKHRFIGSMQGDRTIICQLPDERTARDDKHTEC